LTNPSQFLPGETRCQVAAIDLNRHPFDGASAPVPHRYAKRSGAVQRWIIGLAASGRMAIQSGALDGLGSGEPPNRRPLVASTRIRMAIEVNRRYQEAQFDCSSRLAFRYPHFLGFQPDGIAPRDCLLLR
jgi:hypothetical protein